MSTPLPTKGLNYDSEDETTLDLPRILCFHGGGTNPEIFRAQTRMLRRVLRSKFRFCFVEAPYISHPGPDVVKVFKHMAPFKAWLCRHQNDEVRDAIKMTDRLNAAIENAMLEDDGKGANGDWVGVFGFSQGAKVAASLLYTQQYQNEVLERASRWPQFKFGILLAGRAPVIWMDSTTSVPTGLVDASALSGAQRSQSIPLGRRLRTATLHVHGLTDPGLQFHREFLYQNFDQKSTMLFEWEGEHKVPSKSVNCRALAAEIVVLARQAGTVL